VVETNQAAALVGLLVRPRSKENLSCKYIGVMHTIRFQNMQSKQVPFPSLSISTTMRSEANSTKTPGALEVEMLKGHEFFWVRSSEKQWTIPSIIQK